MSVAGRSVGCVSTGQPLAPDLSPELVARVGAICEELAALVAMGYPFYKPEWNLEVVGLVLTPAVDWSEATELLTESYAVMAPQKLARLVVPSPP